MKHTVKRSSLFLTELVLSLLIFIVCAVVCVSLLVSSYSISRESSDLTQAVFAAEQAAEDWKAYAWPQGDSPDDVLRFYDENWQLVTDRAHSAYHLTLTVQAPQVPDSAQTAAIAVNGSKGVVYTLTVSRVKEELRP